MSYKVKTVLIESIVKRSEVFKLAILLLMMAIIISSSYAQSIGGALSGNNNGNVANSQHSITASDLSSLCSKKNAADARSLLEKRGWVYMKVDETNGVKTSTMALEPNYYDEDRAMAWILIQSDADGVQRVLFTFSTDKFIRTFEQTISKAGFRPFDVSAYSDDANYGYQTADKILTIRHDYNGYTVECIKKKGRFDALNGKKREDMEDGGYAEYSLTDGLVSGLVKIYDEDGTLVKEYYMKKGVRNGQYKKFHSGGSQVSVVGNYENGKRHGTAIFYTQQGNVWKEVIYDHDLLKEEKMYEGDGLLVERKEYDDSQKMVRWTQIEYNHDDMPPKKTEEITTFAGDSTSYKKYLFIEDKPFLVESLTLNGLDMFVGWDTIYINRRDLWVESEDGEVLPQSIFADHNTFDGRVRTYIGTMPKGSVSFLDMRNGAKNGDFQFRCYVDSKLHKEIYVDKTEVAGYVLPATTDTNALALYWKIDIADKGTNVISELYNPLTGAIHLRKHSVNSKSSEVWQSFLSDRSVQLHFVNGVLEGEYLYKDAYGLEIEGIYQDGKKEGVWSWWKEGSQERMEVTLHDNLRNGLCKYTNSLGNTAFETKYASNLQSGLTKLNDIYGNNVFKVYFSDGAATVVADYRDKDTVIVYSKLQSDTFTVSITTPNDVTKINYLHSGFEFNFMGNSTVELASLIDSMWSCGVLKAAGLFVKTSADKSPLVQGIFGRGQQQVGEWTFHYPGQEVKMVYNYSNGETRYYNKSGEEYNGTFEYIDTAADIKEVRKVKGGFCNTDKVKRYHLSSNKRYKGEYTPNYFPVSAGSHNLVFPNTVNIDHLVSAHQSDYIKYSENWPSFMEPSSPSFSIDTAELDAILPINSFNCLPIRLFKKHKNETY